MDLFEPKAVTTTKTGRRVSSALIMGASLLMASTAIKAAPIDVSFDDTGYQYGFVGWAAPENWEFSDPNHGFFSEDGSVLNLVASETEIVWARITMPTEDELDVDLSGLAKYETGEPFVGGVVPGDSAFSGYAAVEFNASPENFSFGGSDDEFVLFETGFDPGFLFEIGLYANGGELNLSNFVAPSATVAQVPEPGTLLLLGLGLAGLGASRLGRQGK